MGRARAQDVRVSTCNIETRRLRGRWRDGKAHVLLRVRTGLLETQHLVECPTREQGQVSTCWGRFRVRWTPGKRRRIQDDVRDNKGDWLLSVVHVHPEDLRWTKKGWLQLKD